MAEKEQAQPGRGGGGGGRQRGGGGQEAAKPKTSSSSVPEEVVLPGETDVTDESADTQRHMADVGYTVTSHGDGTPTIAPQLVERREEVKEYNSDPDRENREIAEGLK